MTSFLAALTLLPAGSAAVSLQPGTDSVAVTIKIPTRATVFQMPAWAPGDYDLLNYGKVVKDIAFTLKGQPVSADHAEGSNTWSVPGGADQVTYRATPSRGNFSPNLQIRDSETYISPPGVIGWFEGTQSLRHTLALWGKTFIALPETDQPNTFEAPNYDELLDAPFVVGGAPKVATKTFAGKVHRVVFYGRSQQADPEAFLNVGIKAAQQAKALFGELPYPSYTFFFDMGGQGGGLEHKNCTRIGISSRGTAEGSVGIMFHEYFHCFNVKRIRAKSLGPFDYTKKAETSTIWWLEGTTDYYADLLAFRAGLSTPENFLSDMSWTIKSVENSPSYARVSAEEASRRVWEVRGSNGFGGVSYYTWGKAAGLFLDLSIRARTKGKRSLDDVIRALYKETKGASGYGEERIRELCIQYGGAELGPLYDAAVRKPAPLPWASALKGSGLKWGETLQEDPDASDAEMKVALGYLSRDEQP